MKKFLFAISVLILILSVSVLNAADYSYVDTVIPGKWNIYGQGYGEKGVVRLSLGLEGNLNILNQKVEEISDTVTNLLDGEDQISRVLVDNNARAMTSYDMYARLEITGAGIKIWSERFDNGIKIPVLLPPVEPTVNDPFILPTITVNNISYTLRFESESSGVLRVHGYVDVDNVGECEIKADCTVWKDGTERPSQSKSTSSGCNFGIGSIALGFIFLLMRRGNNFVRN